MSDAAPTAKPQDSQTEPVPQKETVTAGANKEEKTEETESLPVTLYVGELPHSVTEAILYEIFSNIGPVTSIRVCRDAVTYESLGYAYVNFSTHDDAERAIQELNYALIKGKQCRIMWSQRDPSIRKSGKGNVFIKNLDPSIDNKALHDTFALFGQVLSCKIVVDRRGKSLGYGFVHFETDEIAAEAIETVNGMMMNGQPVFVARHMSRPEREAIAEEQRAQFTNVYINNLGPNIEEQTLRDMFSKFGEIKTFKLVTPEDNKNKSFALVDFTNHDSAQKAVDELNDTEVDGLKIYVGRAQSKYERKNELKKKFEKMRLDLLNKFQGTNLYIKNLHDSVDNEKLKEIFSPLGNILSAKVMVDSQGKSRGFGFVSFGTPEEANKAITEMNGQLVSGKPLYVTLAQRKEIRQSQMKQHFNAQKQLNMKQQAAASGMPSQMMGNGLMYPNSFMNAPGGVRMPYPPGPPQVVVPRGGPQMWQQAPPKGVAVAAPIPPVVENLEKMVEKIPEDQKKQVIGEALFPKILAQENNDNQLASKITGMLLDMDNAELLRLAKDDALLKEQVQEAHAAYMDYLESENKN
ncbi:polyadenylate-binding protein [Starmerella bacillaris]|uniref:Polyadenylate-binding protein n=1 Tax=Starmerella bacillaris TaxID=1247836 RepID=A0AAV5RHH5_STABA|nr:polyadenylate-binding protein [Starmerella bacillaris]